MTALATGAAARPPVVSLPLTPPFSMMTATAIFGLPFSRAYPENHACGGVSLPLTKMPVSAVPVLPATVTPGDVGDVGRMPGAFRVLDDAEHHRLQVLVQARVDDLAQLLGLVSVSTDRFGPSSFWTR